MLPILRLPLVQKAAVGLTVVGLTAVSASLAPLAAQPSADQTSADQRAFSIAHRGASAYAPEHTIEAYRLALEQGADYVEQDLVITKDGVLVCLHDPTLERTTNVEEIFPDRFTEDTSGDQVVKRWFPEDFTLAEIKRLDAGATFDPRFAGAQVLTFQEAIDLVKGKAGLFPELKTPGRLREKGFDMERAVAEVLKANDLVGATLNGRPAVHLQVFEEDSVRRLAELLPEVPRSFLIGSADAARRWLTPAGLKEMRTFATGVAPAKHILEASPTVVADAHAAGLTVVPYTFRLTPKEEEYRDAPPEMRQQIAQATEGLPETPEALTAEMRRFIEDYEVDGLFTDNPDLFPR